MILYKLQLICCRLAVGGGGGGSVMEGRWLRTYFFGNSHRIFTLFALPLGTKLHPQYFQGIVLTTPLRNYKA